MRHRINFFTKRELPTDTFVGVCTATGDIIEGPLLAILAHVAKALATEPHSWRVMREGNWHGG
jgi:hypothetical protein